MFWSDQEPLFSTTQPTTQPISLEEQIKELKIEILQLKIDMIDLKMQLSILETLFLLDKRQKERYQKELNHKKYNVSL